MSMREISLWAYHERFGTICRDARLGGGDKSKLGYPEGTERGQAGWQMAVKFANAHDLAEQLKAGLKTPGFFCGRWLDSSDCDPIQRGEVKRLAILAHGLRGEIIIDGEGKPPLTVKNISDFHDDLHNIGLFTDKGSTILFMGCLAAQGAEGTALLQTASTIWPGRTIVGFTTLGYRHPGAMKRSGEACEEPGMRDTNSLYTMIRGQSLKEFDPFWSDLTKLPWASETSPHAKVVRDGVVVRWPVGESSMPPPPPVNKSLKGPASKTVHPAGRQH